MDDRERLEKRVAELERQVAAFRGGGLFPARGIRKRADWGIGDIPFYDIAFGADPERGELRGHAKGIIAIGDFATGFLALGGLSRGVVAFGGLAAGLFSFGGLSLGLLSAIGGLAIGGLALGGAAVGGAAIGGGAYRLLRLRRRRARHPRGGRDAPRPRSGGVLQPVRPRGRLHLGRRYRVR